MSSSSSSSKDKKRAASSGRLTIRTLADLNRQPAHGSDSDSDDPQDYYTGGEKSGMLVQDPSKGNHNVNAILDQARQNGAMQVPFVHQQSSSSRSFTGTGRLLSGDTVPSAPQQPEDVFYNIDLWSNGFTVNDGPLRRFDDRESIPFLESIMRSECPKELQPADMRAKVHLNLTKKSGKYPEPAKDHTSFQGVGRILGSTSSTDPETSEPAITTAPAPRIGLFVDDALPTTSIQLRLADGTRMVARFNYHHTVGDIRGFIDASRPGAARTYRLQTVDFPPKRLTDLTKTIKEAGLHNSVVIQKL